MGPRGFLFEGAFAMALELCLKVLKSPKAGDVVFSGDLVGWLISADDVGDNFPVWALKAPVSTFKMESIEIPSVLPTLNCS